MANIIECPIICTRGAIIFPGQDMSLDVGRRASVDVVNFSLNMNLDVILVSQKNIDIDEPKKNDLYFLECCTFQIFNNLIIFLIFSFSFVARSLTWLF